MDLDDLLDEVNVKQLGSETPVKETSAKETEKDAVMVDHEWADTKPTKKMEQEKDQKRNEMQFNQLAPDDDWRDIPSSMIRMDREHSGSTQSKEEEKESNEWSTKINKHGSFHTPMVKSAINRRESSAWHAYNKLEERRKESDDWGADFRK